MSSISGDYRFPNYPWGDSRKRDKSRLWKLVTQRLEGFFPCFKPMKSGTRDTATTRQPKKIGDRRGFFSCFKPMKGGKKDTAKICQPNKTGEGDHRTRGDINHISDPQLNTGSENSLNQHHVMLPLDAMGKLTYVTPAGQYPLNSTLDEFVSSDEEETCGNLSQEDTEDKENEEQEEEKNELTEWWKSALASDKVEDVKLSNLLANAPCVVVPSKYGWCTDTEWIMLSEALSDPSRRTYMKGSKVLVINPRHPIIKKLWELVVKDPGNASVKQAAKLMYQTALMECSFMLIDTKDFATQIYNLLKSALYICTDAMEDVKEPKPETKPEAAHGTSDFITDEL